MWKKITHLYVAVQQCDLEDWNRMPTPNAMQGTSKAAIQHYSESVKFPWNCWRAGRPNLHVDLEFARAHRFSIKDTSAELNHGNAASESLRMLKIVSTSAQRADQRNFQNWAIRPVTSSRAHEYALNCCAKAGKIYEECVCSTSG